MLKLFKVIIKENIIKSLEGSLESLLSKEYFLL